jgi:hypothetical protein
MTNDNQHWMISVRDSINDYREVQTGYFDGSKAGAAEHFRNSKPWAKWFGNQRYQIVMRTNPEVLQEPGEPVRLSLYEDAVRLGLELDHHETDLYLKDCPEARALLAEHDKRGRRVYVVDGWNVSLFHSEIDNAPWLDIPFNYDPAWPDYQPAKGSAQ